MLGSCEKCWEVLCECGHQYKDLPLERVEKIARAAARVAAERRVSSDEDFREHQRRFMAAIDANSDTLTPYGAMELRIVVGAWAFRARLLAEEGNELDLAYVRDYFAERGVVVEDLP